MDHEDFYENTWGEKEQIWDLSLRKDVLCLVFVYAGYSKYMREKTGFGKKGCSSFPPLG